jgi:hypothetical protein
MTSPLDVNEYFNALSEKDKKRILASGFGFNLLHSGLAFAVPLWWMYGDQEDNLRLRNGSAFLVNYGRGIFAVTAAHVFAEYREAKGTAHTIVSQLGHAVFEPEAKLIDCRDDLDIVTFRVRTAEAKQINTSIVSAGPPHWEPLSPAAGYFAFLAGFPAQTRGMTSNGHLATAPYCAMPRITSVTDHQITCRFDRESMIDLGGGGLPPPGYDIGGVGGGPLLVPTLVHEGNVEGVVWRLGGVVVQAARGELFEQVVAVRAHYIQPDGRIG